MKVLFVTNVITHYRAALYEKLAERLDIRFLFYSDGQEWYLKSESQALGGIPGKILKGCWVGRTRIVPGLIHELLRTNYDVVVKCINGRFALPVTFAVSRARAKPFVLWTSLWRHPTGGFHKLTGSPTRMLYRQADAVVTYGSHVSRHVLSQGALPERVFEAPQAVDLERFSASATRTALQGSHESTDQRPTVLYVGRLERWKGPQILLRALAEVARDRAFTAVFAGDGSMHDELVTDAQQLGLTDRVRFIGAVANEDLPPLYRTAAMVVVPSIETSDFSEPWSLAVNEALASCKPVIASDVVGAAREGLVTHNRSGLIVPSGDPTALSQAIRETLDQPQKAGELALEGHRMVSRYSYEAAAEAFDRALGAALRTRRPSLARVGPAE